MIKKFDDFIINELKFQTYFSAANKLRNKGGLHNKRGDEIQRYAYYSLGKHLGEFNMNYNIIQKMSRTNSANGNTKLITFVSPMESPIGAGETIYQQGPHPAYICGAVTPPDYDGFTEWCDISFMVFGVPSHKDVMDTFDLFGISISIEWKDGTFKIVKGSASLFDYSGEGIIKFSDRKSAVKFKSKFLEEKNFKKMCGEIDTLRDIFMEYSDATEWSALFHELRNINTNDLYM